MMQAWRHITQFLLHQRGSAAVEFALMGPIIIFFLVGTFEAGRAYWTWNNLQYATDEAGRYVMMNNSLSDSAITSYVRGNIQAVSPTTGVTVTITTDSSASPSFKVITASYTFVPRIAILSSGITMSGVARVPLI